MPAGSEQYEAGDAQTYAPARRTITWRITLSGMLWTAWASGVAVVACVLIGRARDARRWRKHCTLVKDADVLALCESLAGDLGVYQPPVLFVSDACDGPVVFGALRTSVVLPAKLLAPPDLRRLRLILRHELAHIRRGDLLWSWLGTAVWSVFYFHPLVWIALRELRLNQELACDACAVASRQTSAGDYGTLLVELAENARAPANMLVTVGIAESFESLKRRLTAMKEPPCRSRWVRPASLSLLSLAVVALLPWRLVAQPPKPAPESFAGAPARTTPDSAERKGAQDAAEKTNPPATAPARAAATRPTDVTRADEPKLSTSGGAERGNAGHDDATEANAGAPDRAATDKPLAKRDAAKNETEKHPAAATHPAHAAIEAPAGNAVAPPVKARDATDKKDAPVAAEKPKGPIATIAVRRLKIAVDAVRWGGGAGTMVDSGFPMEPGFRGNGNSPGFVGGIPGVPAAPGGFVAPAGPNGFAVHVGPNGIVGGQGGFAVHGGQGFAGGGQGAFGGGGIVQGGFGGGAGPGGIGGVEQGGFIPAMGLGGFGGAAVDTNLVVDLHVSGPKADRTPLMCTVVGKVQGRDDRGNAIDAPDMPAHLKLELTGFDYPRGNGRTAVHLNVKNNDAKCIKSLSGELLVADAKVRTFVFEGKDLKKLSARRLGGATLRLDKVESTPDGVSVNVSISTPENTRGGDPLAAMRGFGNTQGRLRVTLLDSEGNSHEPERTSGGVGGGWFSSFTVDRGVRRDVRGGSSAASQSSTFAALPEGVTVKKIICTVTDLAGKPQRVAFRFGDLPLP